jgi:hypothetical protein
METFRGGGRMKQILGVLVAMLVVPAVAQAQNVRIVNRANISASEVSALEAALTGYSQALSAAWASPAVTFDDSDPSAWPILLSSTPVTMGDTETGWHAYGASDANPSTPSPFAEIYWQDPATVSLDFDEMAVSHEFAEMVTDQDGTGREIADPVEGLTDATKAANGVTLSDFVEPSYFSRAPCPQDSTGALVPIPAPKVRSATRPHHIKQHGHRSNRPRHPHEGSAWFTWSRS